MKTIVALVDFTDVTFKVLKQVHKIAKPCGSHVILLHVVPMEPSVIGFGLASPTVLKSPSAESCEADSAKLKELQDSLTGLGLNCTTKQLTSADIQQVLAECAAVSADMLVVGSHSHGALYHFLVSSVTDEILRNARLPVLVVPCDAEAA